MDRSAALVMGRMIFLAPLFKATCSMSARFSGRVMEPPMLISPMTAAELMKYSTIHPYVHQKRQVF